MLRICWKGTKNNKLVFQLNEDFWFFIFFFTDCWCYINCINCWNNSLYSIDYIYNSSISISWITNWFYWWIFNIFYINTFNSFSCNYSINRVNGMLKICLKFGSPTQTRTIKFPMICSITQNRKCTNIGCSFYFFFLCFLFL